MPFASSRISYDTIFPSHIHILLFSPQRSTNPMKISLKLTVTIIETCDLHLPLADNKLLKFAHSQFVKTLHSINTVALSIGDPMCLRLPHGYKMIYVLLAFALAEYKIYWAIWLLDHHFASRHVPDHLKIYGHCNEVKCKTTWRNMNNACYPRPWYNLLWRYFQHTHNKKCKFCKRSMPTITRSLFHGAQFATVSRYLYFKT